MNTPLNKRFWDVVSVREDGDGYAVFLDERQLKTPAKASLIVPTMALADGVAAEWNAVEGEIKPLKMHLTRCANATIDKVAHERVAVAAMLAEYGGTDLICYRANSPEELVERQGVAWDPLLEWIAAQGAPLTVTAGVMFTQQPENSLRRMGEMLLAFDPWQMTAMHDLVTISGSLVLALAVSEKHLSAEHVWPLSRIDEAWQEDQWGPDEEATKHANIKRGDFLKAADLLDLVES